MPTSGQCLPSRYTMKTSQNPIPVMLDATDESLDRQLPAHDFRRKTILPAPDSPTMPARATRTSPTPLVAGTAPNAAKRRARSAFIDAIAEFMSIPGLDAHFNEP